MLVHDTERVSYPTTYQMRSRRWMGDRLQYLQFPVPVVFLTALSMLVSILLISDSVAQSPGFLVTRLKSSPPVARSMIM